MSELFRVSKPGCTVQLLEGRPPTPKGPAMEEVSRLVMGLFQKTGHSYDVLYRLDQLLADVGFTDIRVQTKGVPVGTKWGDEGVKDAKTIGASLRSLDLAFEKAGLIQSVTEYSAPFRRDGKRMDEHGSEFECRLVTARRPFKSMIQTSKSG